MSTLLPKIKAQRGNIGTDLWIHFPDISSFERTYLSGDEAAAQTILSVLSSANFAAGEFIVIGTPGAEQTEIRKISSVATGTITVTAAITFDHNQGTAITFIPFDQIEVYSASSSGGSFSLLSAVSIRADALETYYPRTSDASTIYYKSRFKNSGDTTYSDYSDEVAATGYAYNTVWAVKNRALMQRGDKIEGSITDEFLNESLWEGRRDIDNQLKRWSWRTAFNSDIGNLVEGQYSVSVPSTLRNPDSPQNILGLKIGSRGRNITYIPKRQFDFYYEGIEHTTVATQPSVGQTTLVLTNVRDIDASGSVRVGADTITYTSKSNSTNTLSGVPASGTGSITIAHAVGIDAWQNVSYGEPTLYTIFENTIFFNVPFDSDFEGDNLFSDYYRTLPDYDSDADVLDEPDVDCLVSYLKYKLEDLKTKGKVKKKDNSDYHDYLDRLGKILRKEVHSQEAQFSPEISHLIGEE